MTAAGIHARLLISRPRGVTANLTLPAMFHSVSLVVWVMGSRWLSTKSRYSESLLVRAKSNPPMALSARSHRDFDVHSDGRRVEILAVDREMVAGRT